MAEGLNVRIPPKLKAFVDQQTGPDGLYESASEFVRELIREKYEHQHDEAWKWEWLKGQLRPGMEADESEFQEFHLAEFLAEMRAKNGL